MGGGRSGQLGLLLLFRIFPLRLIYLAMAFVVLFYLLFAAKGRNAVFHYFRKRLHYSLPQAIWKSYLNHYYFGQVVLDRFAVYSKKKSPFSVTVDGLNIFEEATESEKGAVLLSAHVGNYELLGYLLRQEKKQITALVYAGDSSVSEQQREKILTKNNIRLVSVGDDMSHLFEIKKTLEQGDFMSLLSDRSFQGNQNVDCEFLGAKAPFPLSPYLLAEQFEVPAIAVFAMKTSAKHFRVYIRKLSCRSDTAGKKLRARELLENYVSELEKIVKLYPAQWYNYFEFWKTEKINSEPTTT